MIVIDGKNKILGRLAVFAAKNAIKGEEIRVINCNEIIISGKPEIIEQKFLKFVDMGDPKSGPFIKRQAKWIVKRTIKRMLPHQKQRGRDMLKKIKCFNNAPEALLKEKITEVPSADASKLKSKYVQLSRVIKRIGGKL